VSSEPDRRQDHPQSPLRRREHLREAVAPQASLNAILPLINLQARQLMIQVQTELASDLSCGLCDSTMVEQVLLNLARNAIPASAVA
jgi:two-component system sensor histidine kinase DctS